MKKRRLYRCLAFLICCVLLLSLLISCGDAGESAYETAVRHGFVGTEEEWLKSLHGEDIDIEKLYERAKAEGFTGDFLSFLETCLNLDSEKVAEAILAREETTAREAAAKPLLASVSVFAGRKTVGTPYLNSAGSGVILALAKARGSAYVLTNYHVLTDDDTGEFSSAVYISLYGATTAAEVGNNDLIRATYIGGSATYDVAVLLVEGSEKIRESSALPVLVRDSDTLLSGDDVLAIGNARGQGITVTRGVVSSDSKEVTLKIAGITGSHRLIQTDAAVNEGNSGGGLFDTDGRLVGIVNSRAGDSSLENIGYAIPSNIAVRAADSIIRAYEGQTDPRYAKNPVTLSQARLGIGYEILSSHAYFDATLNATRVEESLRVAYFTDASPAKDAGLSVGDFLISVTVDGKEIPLFRSYSLQDATLLMRRGSSVTILYDRSGEQNSVTFTIPDTCFETVT